MKMWIGQRIERLVDEDADGCAGGYRGIGAWVRFLRTSSIFVDACNNPPPPGHVDRLSVTPADRFHGRRSCFRHYPRYRRRPDIQGHPVCSPSRRAVEVEGASTCFALERSPALYGLWPQPYTGERVGGISTGFPPESPIWAPSIPRRSVMRCIRCRTRIDPGRPGTGKGFHPGPCFPPKKPRSFGLGIPWRQLTFRPCAPLVSSSLIPGECTSA